MCLINCLFLVFVIFSKVSFHLLWFRPDGVQSNSVGQFAKAAGDEFAGVEVFQSTLVQIINYVYYLSHGTYSLIEAINYFCFFFDKPFVHIFLIIELFWQYLKHSIY